MSIENERTHHLIATIIAEHGDIVRTPPRPGRPPCCLGLKPLARDEIITVVMCREWRPGTALRRPDNRTAPCAWACGRWIQHRPDAPAAAKVCLQCCAERPRLDQ